MEAESYRVLFDGRISQGKDPREVKARLARLFGKSADDIEALFSGKPSVLRTVRTLEDGQKMVQAIARAGAVARLEPPLPANSPDTDEQAPEASLSEPAGVRYRLKITIAALLVGLIWLLHFIVIGSLTAGLLYHLLFNLSWYADYGPAALLLHTLPGVIGVVLLAALVKPLLPLRRRPVSELSLAPERQPQLHDFVRKVCGRIAAPVPSRIIVTAGTELDTDFGYLPEVPARAPALRLGLTLISGMTATQLAGSIACELGFMGRGQAAQRTQFVRASHRRLRQASFEADTLDHLLEHLEEGPAYMALMSRGAAALLGISRKLHRGLLRLVHGVASGALTLLADRSDRLQAKLAGSDGFRATVAKRRLLEVAFETAAGEEERRWYEEGYLSERLPAATLAIARAQSAHFQREVQELMRRPATGAYGLRPADVQRIERVEQARQPALFVDGRPARELVSGFERLSRRVSYLYYRNTLSLPATADRLIPAAAEPGKTELILRHYLLDLHRAPVSFNLSPPSGNGHSLRSQIGNLAQQMKAAQAPAGAALQKYFENDHRLVEAYAREALAGAKLPLPDDRTDIESIQQECRRLENVEEELLRKLQDTARLPAQRLGLGLSQLGNTAPNGILREIERLRSALRRTDEVMPKLRSLRSQTIMMELLLSHLPAHNQALADRIEEQATDLRQLLLAIRLSLREAPWPFGQAGPKDNLARHAMAGDFRQADPDELLDIAAATLSRTQAIRQQILARVVQLAMSAEKRLAATK